MTRQDQQYYDDGRRDEGGSPPDTIAGDTRAKADDKKSKECRNEVHEDWAQADQEVSDSVKGCIDSPERIE